MIPLSLQKGQKPPRVRRKDQPIHFIKSYWQLWTSILKLSFSLFPGHVWLFGAWLSQKTKRSICVLCLLTSPTQSTWDTKWQWPSSGEEIVLHLRRRMSQNHRKHTFMQVSPQTYQSTGPPSWNWVKVGGIRSICELWVQMDTPLASHGHHVCQTSV